MIGDILRQEREKQNLTIQDIERETSIRALYIEALEQGEYDKLPGEVYAKGFIKNYANFLELDGDDMVKKFVMEISPTAIAPEEAKPVAEKSDAKVTAETPAENPTVTKTRAQRRAESDADSDDDKKKYLVAAAAALILFIGGLIFAFSGGEENTVAQPEVTQPVETAQETPPAEPQPQQIAQVIPPSGVNLQATFSGDCWTQVVIDGALVYEGMINAGQTFDWNGAQNVYVVLGNAGAANFVMNGQDIGAIGADGAVVERVFTR